MPSSELDFDDFYRARAPGLIRALHLAFGERSRAEDAVQEAFIRCWQRWEKLDADPIAWTRTVAWRLYVDEWRKATRRTRREHWTFQEPEREDPQFRDCAGLLQSLTPEQRATVVLHYLDDLSIEEVAGVLNISTGTVKSRLSRSRERMRQDESRSDHGRT